MTCGRLFGRATGRLTPALLVTGFLATGLLAGCVEQRVLPCAWNSTEEDPGLLVRVPEGTPETEPAPSRECVPLARRARHVGEIDESEPRLACCPDDATGEKVTDRNEASVFLGWTTNRGEGGPTVGVDYERRLSRLLGVGVFAEHVWGSFNVSLAGAGVFLHPTERLRLLLAGGREHLLSGENRVLGRVGGAYTLYEDRHFKVSPAIYVDMVERENPATVMGLEVGKSW